MNFKEFYKIYLENSNDEAYLKLAENPERNNEELQRMVDSAAKRANLPTSEDIIKWFDNKNPFEDEGLYASDISSIFIVGSRARGTSKSDSDYDVAVEFSAQDIEDTGFSSIKLSEMLHQKFGAEMPMVGNLDVDIQIFKQGDSEQANYSKISLDPVTYDHNGNVIPLSSRFDSTKDDIRY